jgi:hypothetical protein
MSTNVIGGSNVFQLSHFLSEMDTAAIFQPLLLPKKGYIARGLLT